jgi:hypothetical protein
LTSIVVALLGWAASLLIVWVQPVQAQSFIAIQKQPVIIRKHFSDPPPPVPTGDIWSTNDSGNAFWSFTIKPALDYDVTSLEQFGRVWRAEIAVKSATVKLGFLMDIFLGEHPSPSEIERQEGYALICQRYYNQVESTVKAVFENEVANKISAEGPDPDTALKNAVSKASSGLAYSYYMNSGYKALRVGRAYDLICSLTNFPLPAAINRAFELATLRPSAFNSPLKKKRPPMIKTSIK